MPQNEAGCWCEAFKLVPRHLRMEFMRFIEEGEASEDFLSLLGSSPEYRQACELVFRADTDMAAVIAAGGGERLSNESGKGPDDYFTAFDE